MEYDVIIKVEHLSKKFCKSLRKSLIYAFYDVLKAINPFYKIKESDPIYTREDEFIVLNDINFELNRGDSLGLMGINGSGKTTLLRLMYGIYPFDKGKVTINGRVGALLAAGVGFHPHMTGRENIYVNGSILGMSHKEIEGKLDEIIEFADIKDFIDAPSATYSSGMNLRLGFSIVVHSDIDILMADEALAVGDAKFREKCFEKIKELQDSGVSVVFVAHSSEMIKRVCNKALYLKNGKVASFGDTNDVIKMYENDNKLKGKESKI